MPATSLAARGASAGAHSRQPDWAPSVSEEPFNTRAGRILKILPHQQPVVQTQSCERPLHNAGAGNWTGVNGDNSTGDDWAPSVSKEPFYVSGDNSQFTVINGVYQPIIQMTVRLLSSTQQLRHARISESGNHL